MPLAGRTVVCRRRRDRHRVHRHGPPVRSRGRPVPRGSCWPSRWRLRAGRDRIGGEADELSRCDTRDFFADRPVLRRLRADPRRRGRRLLRRRPPGVPGPPGQGPADPADPPVEVEEVEVHGRTLSSTAVSSCPGMPRGRGVRPRQRQQPAQPAQPLVAGVLQRAGLGTLLFDLLDPGEEQRPGQRLRHRPAGAAAGRGTRWLARDPDPAACRSATSGPAPARRPRCGRPPSPAPIGAVVSRGGRPDLAGAALPAVSAPTLLIVGGETTSSSSSTARPRPAALRDTGSTSFPAPRTCSRSPAPWKRPPRSLGTGSSATSQCPHAGLKREAGGRVMHGAARHAHPPTVRQLRSSGPTAGRPRVRRPADASDPRAVGHAGATRAGRAPSREDRSRHGSASWVRLLRARHWHCRSLALRSMCRTAQRATVFDVFAVFLAAFFATGRRAVCFFPLAQPSLLEPSEGLSP